MLDTQIELKRPFSYQQLINFAEASGSDRTLQPPSVFVSASSARQQLTLQSCVPPTGLRVIHHAMDESPSGWMGKQKSMALRDWLPAAYGVVSDGGGRPSFLQGAAAAAAGAGLSGTMASVDGLFKAGVASGC